MIDLEIEYDRVFVLFDGTNFQTLNDHDQVILAIWGSRPT
jgi:hypothetical protein